MKTGIQIKLIDHYAKKETLRPLAFYYCIKSLSHKGVIHSYRSILPTLCKKLSVSDKTFRMKVSECKKLGYLFIDEAGGLRFRSPMKLINDVCEKSVTGKRRYMNKILNAGSYKEMFENLRIYAIINKKNQIQYRYDKYESKGKRPSKGKKVYKKQCATTSGSSQNPACISRRGISNHLNYKSAMTATRIIRKGVKAGFVKDVKRKLYYGKYPLETFLEVRKDNPKYFYEKGKIFERQCNLITEL